jgi:uncharacterized membrane protein
MAFCPNCGAAVEGKYCAKCGTAVAPSGATVDPGSGSAAGTAQAANYAPANPPVAEAGMTANVAGALCYVLGLITGIVFLVLAPYNQNKFVRFHAFQSIFFHVAFIGIWVVEAILAMIMPWSLSVAMSMISLLISLGALALWVWLIVKAYQNEKFKLPVIGDLAEKQA